MSGKSELAQVTNVKNGGGGQKTWSSSSGFLILAPGIVKTGINKQTNKNIVYFSSRMA